ncbi:MAG: hypothetical protein AAB802_00665, partial [Patescibacteria group bacterium]
VQEAVRVKVGDVLYPALLLDDGRKVRVFPYNTVSLEHGKRAFPSFSPTGVEKDHPSIYVNPETMFKSEKWKVEIRKRNDAFRSLRAED